MSEQYIDLITGRPLEPWAQEAMERRSEGAASCSIGSCRRHGKCMYVPCRHSLRAAVSGDPMSLAVALDFAENPRRHTTLQAPADSMDELREALQVLAAAYREARPRTAVGEPVAYLHTLHMEGGQTMTRLSDQDATVFGLPGRDYSEEYTVTTTPLYALQSPPAKVEG